MEADGFEITTKGLATPKITVSNIFGLMSELIEAHDGLQGAKLTRVKIQSHAPPHNYNNNDVVGNPDIYVIDRFSGENKLTVTFELQSIFALRIKSPKRIILQNRCSVVYKSPECGYVGNLATCDRNVDDCLIHFQNMTGQDAPALSFGGFVGVDKYPS
jgi:lambda family phage minor tail protein L